MAPTKETKVVKAKGKAAAKTDTKTKKAVAKVTKGKFSKPPKKAKNTHNSCGVTVETL
jgi:hypothetical protein